MENTVGAQSKRQSNEIYQETISLIQVINEYALDQGGSNGSCEKWLTLEDTKKEEVTGFISRLE